MPLRLVEPLGPVFGNAKGKQTHTSRPEPGQGVFLLACVPSTWPALFSVPAAPEIVNYEPLGLEADMW